MRGGGGINPANTPLAHSFNKFNLLRTLLSLRQSEEWADFLKLECRLTQGTLKQDWLEG